MAVCTGCYRREATETLASGTWCADCVNAVRVYDYCRNCGKQLSESVAEYAVRQFSAMLCGSPKCHREDDIKRGRLCCDKAHYTDCVCTRSYTCPDHGTVHIGTHD